MLSYIIAFLFGAYEMILLFKLTYAVTTGQKRKMKKLLFIKFITYAVAIGLLYFKFSSSIMFFFCGYITAMPLTAIVLYFTKLFGIEINKLKRHKKTKQTKKHKKSR